MDVTIATHMGHQVARQHNRRNRQVTDKESHIRRNGDSAVWLDVDPRVAYERLFGKAVREYNERQSRDDRKIGDYYRSICKDAKRHPVYEVIVGVYNKDGELSVKEQKAILYEYAKGWAKANPNLAMVGCYWHNDEQGQPHIHVDYIPWSDGYKNGPQRQAGLARALETQGHHRQGKVTAQMQWTRAENDRLEAICRAHGLRVVHPLRGQHSKHMRTEDYKYHQAQLQELRRQAWFEQQELKHQTWQAQQELCRAVDAVEQFKNADDIFQWAESKVNTLTGKTILEAYCDSNNLDYVYWVQACNITPNPDGNFEKYHTQ